MQRRQRLVRGNEINILKIKYNFLYINLGLGLQCFPAVRL